MHPAKAVGRNEMSFGRDTCVFPSNIVLDGVGDLGCRRNPQFATMLPIAKLP